MKKLLLTLAVASIAVATSASAWVSRTVYDNPYGNTVVVKRHYAGGYTERFVRHDNYWGPRPWHPYHPYHPYWHHRDHVYIGFGVAQ